jgi:hypothetical protein
MLKSVCAYSDTYRGVLARLHRYLSITHPLSGSRRKKDLPSSAFAPLSSRKKKKKLLSDCALPCDGRKLQPVLCATRWVWPSIEKRNVSRFLCFPTASSSEGWMHPQLLSAIIPLPDSGKGQTHRVAQRTGWSFRPSNNPGVVAKRIYLLVLSHHFPRANL